jgi:uncharacterized protein (TIGR03437 family)
VDRVWYAENGRSLLVRTATGRVFSTSDFEHWKLVENSEIPDFSNLRTPALPEPDSRIRASLTAGSRFYASGKFIWRSDDGGLNWTNLTAFRGDSILGETADVAVSPANADEVVAAGAFGVWRSLDAGVSWIGLNENLPNLPAVRLLQVGGPNGAVQVATPNGDELVWQSGEKHGWRIGPANLLREEAAKRAAISGTLGAEITATASGSGLVYAGSADGRVWTSADSGVTWQSRPIAPGIAVQRIIVDPADPQNALLVAAAGDRRRLHRTANGGVLWDDISGNLPAAGINGAASDKATGSVYVATSRGLYASLHASGTWTLVREGAMRDVMLDSAGNQLYMVLEGSGVFAALAPHRVRDPRVVSAADRAVRAAAPGALLSVLGTRVNSARTGEHAAPILAASDSESQIQVPFEVTGDNVALSMNSSAGSMQLGLPLLPVSPSIFVDREGQPLVMNGDTGLVLDASAPAKSGARIQILAAGLGLVRPLWPTGLAAPLENPPQVVAPIRVYMDREPLEVTRAILAPGYIGFYLVEVQLPSVVNAGTSELYIEADTQQSNRVRIYTSP